MVTVKVHVYWSRPSTGTYDGKGSRDGWVEFHAPTWEEARDNASTWAKDMVERDKATYASVDGRPVVKNSERMHAI